MAVQSDVIYVTLISLILSTRLNIRRMDLVGNLSFQEFIIPKLYALDITIFQTTNFRKFLNSIRLN